MGMCWHLKTLKEVALEDSIVVEILAEMNAEVHKDDTDGCRCISWFNLVDDTVQKIKFSIKDFFSKCDQIRRFLRT